MVRTRWLSLLIVLLLLSGLPSPVQAEPDEQDVLRQLFSLNRTLEEARSEIALTDQRITNLTSEQVSAEAERLRLTDQLRNRQEAFGKRLRYYSEEGTMASVTFLLASETFSEFLFRLDLVQQILQRDSQLIGEFRSFKSAVERQQQLLAKQQADMIEARDHQIKQEAKLWDEIAAKEAILVGLKDRRGEIEGQLEGVEKTWLTTAKPVLDSLSNSLNSVNLTADFKPDSTQFKLFPPGVTVRVTEGNLNQFFSKHGDLKGMLFRFRPGEVALEGMYDGVRLVVKGRFVVKPDSVLRYEPSEIHVGEFVVPRKTTQEIMDSGQLDVKVGSVLKPWVLTGITVGEGELFVLAGPS